ncbi:MAG: indole-3-glycerol phosphate synthase TrpC, partial [Acidimicrobiales bacterium]
LDAAGAQPATRGFAAALVAEAGAGRLAVIAEVNRRSPSRGDLAPGLVAGVLAKSYGAGRAAALSVLTDEGFFGGSTADLAEARAVVELPLLRKDFTVSPRDVCDARVMGADAVLLIAAALDDAELADLSALSALAADIGLDALVEVHDEAEAERALAVGAGLVGFNQRDLTTFVVDTARAERVAAVLPAGVVAVAESGVRGPADAARLAAAGFHAVLVGESLVTRPTAGRPSTRRPGRSCCPPSPGAHRRLRGPALRRHRSRRGRRPWPAARHRRRPSAADDALGPRPLGCQPGGVHGGRRRRGGGRRPGDGRTAGRVLRHLVEPAGRPASHPGPGGRGSGAARIRGHRRWAGRRGRGAQRPQGAGPAG